MTNKNNILLPAGFEDVLPPAAELEAKTVNLLLTTFEQFGYEQVKAPMMEFETSLLSGQGERLSNQTFRVMDPTSREMMAVRADITTQVARIATSRLAGAPRPLRLSYAGQVLRVEGEGRYTERQQTQTGIELIGSEAIEAEIEAITIAIKALQAVGITKVSMDFSLPALSQAILEETGITGNDQQPILELIERKDTGAIQSRAGEAGTTLASLINAAGPADSALSTIAELIPEATKPTFENLQQVVAKVKETLPVTVTIDPLERHGFEYHSGLAFAFFSTEREEEIGRGGHYITSTNEEATGFTFAVNRVLNALPPAQEKQKVFIPYGTDTEQADELRERGLITVTGLTQTEDDLAEAKRLGCTFIYDEGEIKPV